MIELDALCCCEDLGEEVVVDYLEYACLLCIKV